MAITPSKPSREDFQRVAQNARMMLDDARYLFVAERHRRAVSLAILAIEEIGKIINHQQGSDNRHQGKQNGAKFLVLAASIVRAMDHELRLSPEMHAILSGPFETKDPRNRPTDDGDTVDLKKLRQKLISTINRHKASDGSSAWSDVEVLIWLDKRFKDRLYNPNVLKNAGLYEEVGRANSYDFKLYAEKFIEAGEILLKTIGPIL